MARSSSSRLDQPAPQDAHERRLAEHARRRSIVVIGASAGGVQALLEIMTALPADFDTPIAIVVHRTPMSPLILPNILARRTHRRVVMPATGDPIERGTIFVASPELHLSIRPDRTFSVDDGRRIEHVRSSANPLFESAAEQFGPGVVGVVLSGTGRNGARGAAAIHERGGTVIVQDKHTSPYFDMPSAALQTGAVDFVLPLDEIAHALEVLCPRDLSGDR